MFWKTVAGEGEMPHCVECGKGQKELNDKTWCKKCFSERNNGTLKQRGYKNSNGRIDETASNSDVATDIVNVINSNKPITEYTMKDLIPVIKQAIPESIANDLESIKSSIEELKNLDESSNQLHETIQSIQQRTIQEQPSFLEYVANKDRQNNLIITGIRESEND